MADGGTQRVGDRGGDDDSEEEADFEDAEDAGDNVQTGCRTTDEKLLETLEDSILGLHLFLDNKFEEAIQKVAPLANTSIFHSMGNACLHFVQALMTNDPGDIESAAQAVKVALDLCNKKKHHGSLTNNSVTKIIKRPNYNNYTEEEIHAEMIMADCLLVKSVITMMQDESLVTFVKSGLRIRTSYMVYKECEEILKKRKWTDSKLKNHFKSGVLMGLGSFHLGISGLPARVLKLLEFVGMPGNRDIGLQMLDEGQKLFHTLRGPLCSMFILMFQTMFNFAFGSGHIDVEYCKSVLQPLQVAHPTGTLTLYFAGRIEEIQGNVEEATQLLLKSLTLQDTWKQIKHLCYWELSWCYIFMRQWHKSQQTLTIVQKESRWSKTITSYLLASVMGMRKDLSDIERVQMAELMSNAPNYKRRIAGKSMPMEKFVCKRVARFANQNNWLFLPILEAFYNFNYFTVARRNREYMMGLLGIIERAIEDLVAEQSQSVYFGDNYCLGLLLKGVCLRHLKNPLQAEDCFKELFQNEKKIVEDNHLVPFSLVELGFMYIDLGNPVQASHYFDLAKTYKKISMESRLHLRIHAGLSEIKERSTENGSSVISNGTGER